MDLNAQSEYNTRKLAHYNAWLLDPKREFGTRYPGFPEESPKARKAKAAVEVKAKAKAPVKAPVKKKRAARSGSGPTKQELAIAIYKEMNGDKSRTISAIQDRLAMSLAGATTYFYNARKA